MTTKRTWTEGAVAHELRKLMTDLEPADYPIGVRLLVLSATEWSVKYDDPGIDCAGHCGASEIDSHVAAQADLVDIAHSLIEQVDESVAEEVAMRSLMSDETVYVAPDLLWQSS